MPILLLFVFIFLTACSDTLLYNEATPHISIDILSPISDTVIIVERESVEFRAKINPSSTHTPSYNWYISSRERPYPSTQYKEIFADTGFHTAYFYAVDKLGDTLKSKNITIGVSKNFSCNENINFECIPGGQANFRWECNDINMVYEFRLIYNNNINEVLNRTLYTDSYQLPENYQLTGADWEVRVIAINRFGYTYTIELKENTSCY